AEAGAHSQVGDILVDDARKISAALTCGNGGDIYGRERALSRQRFGEQRAIPDALPNVLQYRPQARRGGALGEELERLQNRKACFDQSAELLVEDQKIGRTNLA